VNKSWIFTRLTALGFAAGVAISGAYLIAPNEGEVLGTYLDPVGIVTSCYGHTGPELKLGRKFTRDECLNQLAADLHKHNAEMMKFVTVPISEYQHAAILSFCYNVGVSACSKSTLFKKLNNFDYPGACAELSKWVYAQGKKFKGLVRRRAEEYKICMGSMPEGFPQ